MTSAIVFEKLLQRMRQHIKPTNKRLTSFFKTVLTPLVESIDNFVIDAIISLCVVLQLLVYAN